ncbi:hypothetical protein EST38_g10845 [Candolleomyces aberdarensis]|uniref:Uncharacterized protein n=1 Tax=Candolleomyces aberdarensis TaxID=2316362 RepID=A0A4Q2D9M9_9AGAR|nr:hypothetical protein EST38_g10845 [Candolleomyces aberdarensis]
MVEGKLKVLNPPEPRRLTRDELHKIFQFPDDWTTESLSENQYWPGDNDLPKHRDVLADLVRSLEPLVTATETASFAIEGPAGVLTSAGIGLIWNLIKPGSTSQYQEDFSAMIGKVLSDSFKEEAFISARSTLDTFNKTFRKAVLNIKPERPDDIIVTKNRIDHMLSDVETGGALTTAAANVKEHLPWFDPSAHRLLVACLDAILQNYQMILVSWEAIATMSLNEHDFTSYNEAKRQVSNILDSVDGLFEQYKADIEKKIADLKKERLEKCNFDKGKPSDSSRKLLYVKVNNREDVLKAMENVYKSIKDLMLGTALRESAAGDDIYLDEILGEALAEYKKRLSTEMEKPFKKLLECVDGIIKRVGTTIQRKEGRYPLKDSLKYGPATVPGSPVKVSQKDWPESLKLGDQVQYLYELHVKTGEESTKLITASPWSTEWSKVERLGELQQIYIGDGYATMPTVRKLYMRTSDSDPEGKHIATIHGVGILTWPGQEPFKQ